MDDEQGRKVPVYTYGISIPMSEELLKDWGIIPLTEADMPPAEPFLPKMRRKLRERYWSLRWRLAEIIAGEPLGTDDCDW